jgi:hypothetical protein
VIKGYEVSKVNINDDPFKYVKVSDFSIDEGTIHFNTVRVLNKGAASQKGIPVYTERTESELTEKKKVTARGRITIDEKLFHELDKQKNNKGTAAISNEKDIVKAVHVFYSRIADNADKLNYTKADDEINEHQKSYISMQNKINSIMIEYNKKWGAAIRLGRFSQVESKTFNIMRPGERKTGKTIPEDININGGISRSIIDGKIPCGWATLHLKKREV